MALMIRECSGIVCLCLTGETADRLELPLMVPDNESRFQTAFTVTVDAREGVTTGVSAQDRVTTIRAAIADDAKASDLARPGHIFPSQSCFGRSVGADRTHRRVGGTGTDGRAETRSRDL